jgi:uncharacterized protein YkwD
MLDHVHTRRRSVLAAFGASAAVALAGTGPVPLADAHAASCSGANANINKASASKLRSALLCLVNNKRASAGLKAIKANRKLEKAATRHAKDMVRRDYFAHQRPGGPDLGERLERAGWRGSAFGETIAYGCGSSASPKATLRGWLNSPPHRAILLSGTYKAGGLGIGAEAPCGNHGATWVLDVGRK